jgi:glycosyltransferase involved in cell wall biosynthesis
VTLLNDSTQTSSPNSLQELPINSAEAAKPLKISVIIIAKNARESIRYTLNSLRDQNRKPDDILIIVPSMDDETVETAKEYGVRVELDPKATRGSARAVGVEKTTGDIVAFIDAECIAHPDWLKVLETVYLENKDVLVQGGPIHRTLDLKQAEMAQTLPPCYPLRYVNFVPTANLSFRRNVVNIAGNFNERLHEGEDLEFCIRVTNHKIPIVLNPAAIVLHLDKTTWSLIRRYANYGKSRAKIFFIHRRSVLPAALIAIFRVVLIPIAILALIIQRYDIFLIAIGLPFAHQVYKFFRYTWQVTDSTLSAFLLDIVLSYTLYLFFTWRLLYLVFSPSARRKITQIVK